MNMKQTLKYQVLSIFQKLKCEVRLLVDHRSVWSVSNSDSNTTSLLLNPYIGISIDRAPEVDSSGSRFKPAWNINDHISMTKLNLPIFIKELQLIQEDFKTPNMYKYTDNRLELNDSLANNSRRVFMIGRTTVELTMVVIKQPDRHTGEETLLEGIKMKFNNESSVTYLTLNELYSLIYNLDHLDVDSIALELYTKYAISTNSTIRGNSSGYNREQQSVDIIPMNNDII